MGWLKRLFGGQPARQNPARRRQPRVLAPVAEIVEQGLLVADVAVRMSVKNEIIMNALAHDVNYDEEAIKQKVRDALADLSAEREADAEHIERMRTEIRRTGRSEWSESDYGTGDNDTLKHRQEVYEGVSAALQRWIEDDEYVVKTATRATELAWQEIAESLKNKASHPYYAGGNSEEYQRERDSRIQDLIANDLAELQRGPKTETPTKKFWGRRQSKD